MSYYTEREGILVTRTGQISLRHAGLLRRVTRIHNAAPAKAGDQEPAFYDVWFADGSTAVIAGPLMRGAIMRRLHESDCSEI